MTLFRAGESGRVRSVNEVHDSDALAELARYGSPVDWSAHTMVTRHPLADEEDTLHRLQLNPSDCTTCDAYWVVRDRLVLVSIESCVDGPPIATFRSSAGRRSFYARTRRCPLSRATAEAVLTALNSWVDDNPDWFDRPETDEPIRVSERDLVEC